MSPGPRPVRVVEARPAGGFRVWLRFDDGASGTVDLARELVGEMFEPLRDPSVFVQFRVGEGHTLEWPNGADFAPEFLRDLVASESRATA